MILLNVCNLTKRKKKKYKILWKNFLYTLQELKECSQV